ncbi:hypothetical protein HPB48_009773 [Haemaphysalis longicornis]|uniref:Uncharacterized protein n=1 Tax=Haemaphysalis longicornis TaxID=44386 RepID=A0A9J6GQD3_HAELO|nr:hypothetical protein HPB48_009773 [Haemaphysalis longicornis]
MQVLAQNPPQKKPINNLGAFHLLHPAIKQPMRSREPFVVDNARLLFFFSEKKHMLSPLVLVEQRIVVLRQFWGYEASRRAQRLGSHGAYPAGTVPSESLENLRNLFAQSVLGRALGDVRNSSVLCLRSTELLLPAIFSRTARAMLRQKTEDVTVREWLSQMVSVFARRVRFLSWMSELSALFVRYRLKRAPLPWLTDGPDGPTGSPVINTTIYSVPVRLFQILASAMQQDLIEGYKGRTLRAERFPTSSELHPFATFDASHRHVRVPTVLVNLSVPLTSSVFAFQLARLGVRLYRPLARVLFDDPYETEAPVDDMAGRAGRRSANCASALTKDATQLYRSEADALGSDEVAGEVLERVTALQIAFWAFQELLNVRRIWNMDFRYAKLDLAPTRCTTSCRDAPLSAAQAVLLAVRHVPDFGRAFNCTGQTKSHLPDGAQCECLCKADRQFLGKEERPRPSCADVGVRAQGNGGGVQPPPLTA